jgi:hypothetical protein
MESLICEIRYEPEFAAQGGFACYVAGELVAVAWNYADGDAALRELIAEIKVELARLANDEPVDLPLAA